MWEKTGGLSSVGRIERYEKVRCFVTEEVWLKEGVEDVYRTYDGALFSNRKKKKEMGA